jgi:REP element-mobilizing transposase RayT
MARRLRIEFAGAVYYVVSRGNRREAVFADDLDRHRFLETLTECCRKTGWQIHAYCLMPNCLHLVIETPQPNLAAGMKWLLGTYTGRHNRRHKESGHLFSGRYKALMVEASGKGYLKTVCDCVHLNPSRAKLLKAVQPLEEFPWSSYRWYLQAPGRRPAWLRVDRLLGEWRIPKDSPVGRRAFGEGLEWRRREDLSREFKPVERNWCLGSEAFRRDLLEQVSSAREGNWELAQEAVEARAEQLLAENLKQMGWADQDLASRRKGDAGKVQLAAELRARTTVPLSWIAARLKMGSRGYLTWLLYRHRRKAS